VGIYAGAYLARVRAVSAFDISSIWRSSILTNLTGKAGLPPAVSFLTATSLLFGIGLKWGFPAGAEDTQRTEIWYGPNNNLGTATKLADLAYPQSDYAMQSLRAGATFFFWARLVDRTGNIGPFYPVVNGVMGQASSEAGPVLDLLTGQLTESQFGQHLLGRIDLIDGDGPGSVNERLSELQDEIGDLVDALVYVPTDAYARDNTVRIGDNLWTAIVNVPAAADGSNGPPNPTYWVNSGQSIRTANGLAAQVTKNTADISTVDGKTTATASQLQALQASSRGDDGSGDLLDALNGWQATASYAQEVRVRTEQDFAQTQRITSLDSRVGTSESKITIVETTMASNQLAISQQVETLKASVGSNQAAIQSEVTARSDAVGALSTRVDTAQAKADGASVAVQETTSALASTNGKLAAIWSVRMELTTGGQPYATGFGLGLENGAAGTTSQFVVRADTFLVMNTNTQNPISFFGITGGQTFIRDAFIQDGSITNAKIGDYICSTNYVFGQTGWAIFKNGGFEMNGQGAGQSRLAINNSSVKVYHANGNLGIDLSI
jgi:predicted phage tail protein